ncbi:twin-arginine translocation signal domain-containing protein [Megasphaera elsdenii]|uniref:twin-arginine translocation signal domain-containing protein n=2 Tax=Megasphaera TaxID=906 RepID=UPI003C6D8E3B
MPGDIHAFSRRTFLKMAAGTAVGAALFSMPALSLAKGEGKTLSKQSLTPVPYPTCTSTCAKMNRMGKISLLRQWPKLS